MFAGIVSKLKLRRLMLFLSILGPGIITASVDNDAGGIATYSIAGAHFGYALLWTLIPITFLLIIVQEMCARMGAVTGKGLSDLIRENFSLKITVMLMIGLCLANLFVTIAEFAGMAAAGELFGVNKYFLIPTCLIFVWAVILNLRYKTLEKFFLLLSFFYISYILSGLMAKPDWDHVLNQLIFPSFSLNTAYLITLLGVIGTTITPWMQFYLQSSIVEKGISIKEYAYSRLDVIIGCIITDVVAFFIIVCCATVLFPKGITVESATEAAKALLPLAGPYTFLLFAIGFFGAALFGAFILPISTSFYICEAFGWESGINKSFEDAKAFYLIILLLTLLAAIVVLIPKIPLFPLMLMAQVINGIILPFILIAILRLINNKKLMGSYVNPPWLNCISWAASIFIIIITFIMVITTLYMPPPSPLV
ncbi:MAG: divalent metal cation transporter [Caldiserica bacterium]|nr:MAG: divalent metal cation transporter [Caldisericota bacterium]